MAEQAPDAPRGRYHHGDLRAALIEAAIDLIAERGVEGFNVADAARRAGVSTAAPYRHFRDKADLVGHVAAWGYEQLSTSCEAALAKHPRGSLEALIALGQSYIAFVASRPELFHLMWGAVRERFEHEHAQCCGERGYQIFISALEHIKRARGLEHHDTYRLGTPLWAMVHGLASLILGENEHLNRDPDDLNHLVANATYAYFAGLERGE